MTQRPDPLPIDMWEKAEVNAVNWMRHWGYRDATGTPAGSDRGLDVVSRDALAQVKWTGKPMGPDAVQRLFGARGQRADKDLLFFTGPGYGYTERATQEAERLGVALFRYDIAGDVVPVNAAAIAIAAPDPDDDEDLPLVSGTRSPNLLLTPVRSRRPETQAMPDGSGCVLTLAVLLTGSLALTALAGAGLIGHSSLEVEKPEVGAIIGWAAFLWLIWFAAWLWTRIRTRRARQSADAADRHR